MSGGSLNYIGHAMEDGNLIPLESALEALPDRLSRCLGVPVQQLSNEAYDSSPLVTPWTRAAPPYRPITDEERGDVARYGKEALQMMRNLLSTIDDFKRQAVALAPLANVMDRWGSGDDGDETVWETILSWGLARETADECPICGR